MKRTPDQPLLRSISTYYYKVKYSCYISVMEQLLQTRIQSTAVTKLEGLSPDRFGTSAYAGLSYTPSKLANNVLFKEAASMRRVEQSSSKARQLETVGQLLRDRLRHLQEEKEGMEQALSQQITMYKRLLSETEAAHEKSLMSLQTAFSDEMQRVIAMKEEEAKFVQCEIELLENRILELQDVIAGMKNELQTQISGRQQAQQRINEVNRQKQAIKQERQRFQLQLRNQRQERQKQKQSFLTAKQQQLLQFARKEKQILAEHNIRLEQAQTDKQRAIDNLTASHREQIILLQQQRINESKIHQEQFKKLKAEWQGDVKRLGQTLQNQKSQIQYLNNTLEQQKVHAAESMKKMASDAATLTFHNKKLEQEVQTVSKELIKVKEQAKQNQSSSTQTSANFQATIQKLKKEVDLARKQVQTHVYQRQKLRIQGQQMKRQIVVLRRSVQRTSILVQQNSLLSRELKGLKDILLQSSLQMQRCKGEFLRLDKQKQILMSKLRELDLQNQTLYQVRLQMEEQVRAWRQTYYLNRR